MIKKGSRVRVKGTDIVGRIKSIDAEAGSCTIGWDCELDELSPYSPREFALSDVIELRKVRGSRRLEVLEDFDLILLSARQVLIIGEPSLRISKIETGYLVRYGRFWSDQDDVASIALTGADAEQLLSEVGKLKAHEWGKGFWPPPDIMVLDGEEWSMDFFKEGSFFHAEGDNAAPKELFDFHDYIASLGIPRMEALDDIASNGWEASTISPWDRLGR